MCESSSAIHSIFFFQLYNQLEVKNYYYEFFPYKLSIFPKITGNVTYNRIMKTEYNYYNFITYKIPKSFHIYVFPIFCFTPLFLQQVFKVYLNGTALNHSQTKIEQKLCQASNTLIIKRSSQTLRITVEA